MGDDVERDFTFSVVFPLPFRVLCLAGLGVLGWATNLHGLHLLGTNPGAVLDLHQHDGRRLTSPLPTSRRRISALDPSRLYAPVYRLFLAHTVWSFAAWLLFCYATRGDIYLVDVFKYIPAIATLCTLIVLVCPFNVFQKRERDKFLNSLDRCLFAPSNRATYFADIVFADVFTSFAKVLGDVWLTICMLLPGRTLLSQPAQEGLSRWILPTLMSIPYAVRLRQCLIDYRLPDNQSRRPLFNAIKYATSFPVIYLSAAQRIVVSDLISPKGGAGSHEAWHSERHLFRIWLLAAAVNSLYSFWWDVTYDWGFELLRPRALAEEGRAHSPPRQLLLPHLNSRSNILHYRSTSAEKSGKDDLPQELRAVSGQTQQHAWGLRETLLFPLPVYPFVIVMDLVLRLTWSAKLSSHLHAYADGDLVIFWIELAELVRRWMWVFIRVEWEVVRERRRGRPSRSPVDEEDYDMVQSDLGGMLSDVG